MFKRVTAYPLVLVAILGNTLKYIIYISKKINSSKFEDFHFHPISYFKTGGTRELVSGKGVNQLAKPAFRFQCAHTEHSEGPMDTILSSRNGTSSFLEW